MMTDAAHTQLFARYFAPRAPWAKKGDAGRVLVVSGSNEYSGSPVFSGVAALRSGSDLVYIVGHPRAMNIAAMFAPDLITVPLAGELASHDVPSILERAERFSALVIGGGLARTEETFQAIRMIVKECTLPMLLDAEAIRAIAGNTALLAGKSALLTPNVREFTALTGVSVEDTKEERRAHVERYAREIGTTILLKGHIDVIADGTHVAENATGVPTMAKGGFGDTLAGIAGALLARGAPPHDAGVLAAYLNGRAGERTYREYGEGMLASDLFRHIPEVLNEEIGTQ